MYHLLHNESLYIIALTFLFLLSLEHRRKFYEWLLVTKVF